MKHTNLYNEIDVFHDEDKWWKRGAYVVAIVFFSYIIARSLITFIW